MCQQTLCLLMQGTFYPSGTLHHNVDKTKSATRKSTVLEETIATFVLARNYILTNTIVSQDNTTGWKQKFQDFAQLPTIVKHVRRLVLETRKQKRDHLLWFIGLWQLLTSQTYTTILFPWNRIALIVFVLTFLNTTSSDIFFRIPIYLTMWIHGMKLYNHRGNQGV